MEHKGFTLWFTGLSASGKTTLADAVANELRKKGMKVERLDGDIVRKNISNDLGFSEEDRNKNIERVTFIAKLLSRNGIVVVASFISPYNKIREYSRREIGNFVLVYLKCPLKICEQRDTKGLYIKARKGEIENFTGISHPFEEPEKVELVVETDKHNVEECRDSIISMLDDLGYIPH